MNVSTPAGLAKAKRDVAQLLEQGDQWAQTPGLDLMAPKIYEEAYRLQKIIDEEEASQLV
ncbi:hypothetical protein [Pigmentiphaga sp.]|uniref:hypothetical protein n=1 Tax=Pigmentiphaga sp. TaxID=1977564 RepID=UPI0025CD104A|nr:hypothetical protein [Pigmentiphaga sp.]